MARDWIPGESGPSGDLRDGLQYLNRLVHGHIVGVEPSEGKMIVSTRGVIGNREITVPVLWFSAIGRQSAWGRYMPFGKGEIIDVGYRNDGTAACVGYNATATQDATPGWKDLLDAQKSGTTPGFQIYKELKRGEFDFKSSGNAYIFGSNAGTLLLAGGQAYIKLERNAYRLDSKAGTYRHQSGTNKIRFGQVYRKETPSSIEESIVESGTWNEFMVDINQILPTGTPSPQSRAFLHFGDIVEEPANTIKNSDKGLPVRGIISLGDAGDTAEAFYLEIDAGGNVLWEQKGTTPPILSMAIGDDISIKFDSSAQEGHIIIGNIILDLTSADNTISFKAGGDTLNLVGNGAATTMKVGNGAVHPAIVEKLQALYNQLQLKLTAFDAHTHPTGVGPSGPPTPMIQAPAWDTSINSTKISIPDG